MVNPLAILESPVELGQSNRDWLLGATAQATNLGETTVESGLATLESNRRAAAGPGPLSFRASTGGLALTSRNPPTNTNPSMGQFGEFV